MNQFVFQRLTTDKSSFQALQLKGSFINDILQKWSVFEPPSPTRQQVHNSQNWGYSSLHCEHWSCKFNFNDTPTPYAFYFLEPYA